MILRVADSPSSGSKKDEDFPDPNYLNDLRFTLSGIIQTIVILPSLDNVCFAPSMKHQPPSILTAEQIRNARNLCPRDIPKTRILEINPSTVLKVGPFVQMGEAEALCLVREKTTVPVPKVLNAYTINGIGFIVMEKVPGVSLADCWDDMAENTRESVVEQLRKYVQEWRQIEGPMFGSVDGGPCQDDFFKHPWDPEPPRRYGPFSSRYEYNQGLVEALANSRPYGLTELDDSLVWRILASGDQDERKILTHGDLRRGHIMVDNNIITGIVDWSEAGYSFPAREYFCMRFQAWDEEWARFSPTILEADEYEFWAEVHQSMVSHPGI